MSNIFENVKFGDKFRTRDGRMAIFHNMRITRLVGNEDVMTYRLICDRLERELCCYEDGREFPYESSTDIIGKWQEQIEAR